MEARIYQYDNDRDYWVFEIQLRPEVKPWKLDTLFGPTLTEKDARELLHIFNTGKTHVALDQAFWTYFEQKQAEGDSGGNGGSVLPC